MRILFILVLIFICTAIAGQKVVDATDKQPISNVIVQLMDEKYNVFDYTITESKGNFNIKDIQRGKLVRFSCMNYKADTISVSSLPQIIELLSQPVEIMEIVVKAPKISQNGDTISYNVNSFSGVADRTIGDVLAKMPGIEVARSGEIKYNGTSINKFYIEGMDMMESRYGVATNSVSFKDVAAVEVLENHQPIHALENVSFSDKAAINLRLKDSAKAKWIGTIKAGGGFPSLYTGEISAMAFNKRVQTLNTLKGNNNGIDVTKQISNLSIADILRKQECGDEIADYIDISPSEVSNVNTFLGNNEVVSTNMLRKLSQSTDLKTSVSFSDSRYNCNVESFTEYYLKDSTINILEIENSLSLNKKMYADMAITTNRKDFYLRNMFKGNLRWSDISLITDGTYPNEQQGETDEGNFNNNLELIKRINRNTFTVTSYNGCSFKPQMLDVITGDRLEREKLETRSFVSNTNVTYSFTKSGWNIFMGGGANIYSQYIDGGYFGYTKLYFTPKVEYKSIGGFMLFVDFPIDYYVNKKSFIPSIKTNISQQLSPKIKLSATIGLGKIAPDNYEFYKGRIMNNYRTISHGFNQFLSSSKLYLSTVITYKNPISQFFANASASYYIKENPFLHSQSFINQYILNSYIDEKNKSSNMNLFAKISKGLGMGGFSLDVSYTVSDAASIRNNKKMDYHLNYLNINASLNGKLTNWFSVEYLANYSINSISESDYRSWTLNQSSRFICKPSVKCIFYPNFFLFIFA